MSDPEIGDVYPDLVTCPACDVTGPHLIQGMTEEIERYGIGLMGQRVLSSIDELLCLHCGHVHTVVWAPQDRSNG